MNQHSSCPHRDPSRQAQRINPDSGASTPWVSSPAAPPRNDDGRVASSPSTGGWWAFAAQARAVGASV